jgi:hypothetical protein
LKEKQNPRGRAAVNIVPGMDVEVVNIYDCGQAGLNSMWNQNREVSFLLSL